MDDWRCQFRKKDVSINVEKIKWMTFHGSFFPTTIVPITFTSLHKSSPHHRNIHRRYFTPSLSSSSCSSPLCVIVVCDPLRSLPSLTTASASETNAPGAFKNAKLLPSVSGATATTKGLFGRQSPLCLFASSVVVLAMYVEIVLSTWRQSACNRSVLKMRPLSLLRTEDQATLSMFHPELVALTHRMLLPWIVELVTGPQDCNSYAASNALSHKPGLLSTSLFPLTRSPDASHL